MAKYTNSLGSHWPEAPFASSVFKMSSGLNYRQMKAWKRKKRRTLNNKYHWYKLFGYDVNEETNTK